MFNQLSSDDHKVRAYEVANRTTTKVVDAYDYRHVLKIDNDTEAVGPGDTTGAEIWWAAMETTPVRNVNVRTTTYRWLAGGAGSDDFYLDLFAGGNPTATLKAAASTERPWPDELVENGTILTRVDPTTSLGVGQWFWGDKDDLDYNTIYVGMAATGDPDDRADNFLVARWVTDRMEKLDAGSKHMQDGTGIVTAPIWMYQRSGATMWPKVCARTV